MSKKKIISILIWLLAIVIIDQSLGLMMAKFAPAHKQDQRIQLLLDHKINADILVVGSSRALNNYSPQIIQNITGKSCYNLGFSGSNIVFHEEILSLALNNGVNPKYVIYNIDDPGTLYHADGISFRFDVLNPYVENNGINKIVCRHNHKYLWPTYLCRSYRHNVNFINTFRYFLNGKEDLDYLVSNIDSNGANLIVPKPGTPPAKRIYARVLPEEAKLNIEYINSFKNIQQICNDRGIKLILCYPPLLMDAMPGFDERIKGYTQAGISVLNFNNSFRDQPEMFLNPDHLNKTGAEAFTRLLVRELKTIVQ